MEPMINVIAPSAFFTNRVHGTSGKALKLTTDDKLKILEPISRFEWCFDAHHLGEPKFPADRAIYTRM